MSDEQAQDLGPGTGSDDARLAELAAMVQKDPIVGRPDIVVSDDTRRLPADQEPRYCWQCGKALAVQESMLPQGFDTLTGERLPDRRHSSRSCMHVTWVRQEDGSWVRI